MVREQRRDNYEKRQTVDVEGYVWSAYWGGSRLQNTSSHWWQAWRLVVKF